MALSGTVTGEGRVISRGNDMGSYSQTITSKKADGSTRTQILTVSYTDIRTERKWYALTEAAITTWESTNAATTNYTASCSNEITNAWELIVSTVTRTITGYSLVDAPESA
jgi:hypothetical protein